jgi:hypothetical protein
MAARRLESIVTYLLQIIAAALATSLVAAHQAPGESWLAPLFMGFLAALLVDQGRAVLAPRRRSRATRAECPLP